MKRVFICGPMSGLSDNNYPAFFAAEKRLRNAGFTVLNPAVAPDGAPWSNEERPWAFYMRHSLAKLITADHIWRLPDWENSKGANLESRIAEQLAIRPLNEAEVVLCEAKKLKVKELCVGGWNG